ncbi:prepilin-type N-terminal cleavage/methylation domain-containing protein [bacterium 1xD8-48]|jgi:type IV pilus assembly protein PilA|nr:prepilin-type N-terminal cleavage/methylation domain-containing protein [Lachnospiraceae bacterium]MCI9325802.1 prepilin-type N-terminal cleavage/methylation domain-containing protein [Lachnospiraceae bacterium]NBJ98760.1 prepilin-type N-terminal cleavage/methylation domain-containing protein [bacterium 1xD8-48]
MLNKLKKNNKKGFTLVELIVVLVILAILAALLIPALTGYIDKARDKQIIAETRQAVMAAQTLVDEKYATKTNVTIGETGDVSFANIKALAEVEGTITAAEIKTEDIDDGSGSKIQKVVVSTLTYENHGKKCVYTAANDEKYAVSTAP